MAVAVAVGRGGGKRSVVVAAEVTVVQWKRWIGMELTMGAGRNHQRRAAGWK